MSQADSSGALPGDVAQRNGRYSLVPLLRQAFVHNNMSNATTYTTTSSPATMAISNSTISKSKTNADVSTTFGKKCTMNIIPGANVDNVTSESNALKESKHSAFHSSNKYKAKAKTKTHLARHTISGHSLAAPIQKHHSQTDVQQRLDLLLSQSIHQLNSKSS
jgi:hypothetical protein